MNIQVNDLVQARLYSIENDSMALQDFVVTAINGTSYEGGALPCDLSDGWIIELLRKSVGNLALPTTISEITVKDISNKEHSLVGKNDVWRDLNGQLFDVNLIIEWREGHGLDQATSDYLQDIADQANSGQ
jgi:predicted heme/steroid binding protein